MVHDQVIARAFQAQVVGAAPDRIERVPHLVGDHRGQPPQRRGLLGAHELVPVGRQRCGHGVERLGELADLVAPVHGQADVEVPPGDSLGPPRQRGERPDNRRRHQAGPEQGQGHRQRGHGPAPTSRRRQQAQRQDA